MIDNRDNYTWLLDDRWTHTPHMRIPIESYATVNSKEGTWSLRGCRGRLISVSRECVWDYWWLLEFADDSGAKFRQSREPTTDLIFDCNWAELWRAANLAYWQRVESECIARGLDFEKLYSI